MSVFYHEKSGSVDGVCKSFDPVGLNISERPIVSDEKRETKRIYIKYKTSKKNQHNSYVKKQVCGSLRLLLLLLKTKVPVIDSHTVTPTYNRITTLLPCESGNHVINKLLSLWAPHDMGQENWVEMRAGNRSCAGIEDRVCQRLPGWQTRKTSKTRGNIRAAR